MMLRKFTAFTGLLIAAASAASAQYNLNLSTSQVI